MDDAAREVANCMEDEPGEMTRQEIIDEVAFTLVDEVAEPPNSNFWANWEGGKRPRFELTSAGFAERRGESATGCSRSRAATTPMPSCTQKDG
jgi:hypothetical protein